MNIKQKYTKSGLLGLSFASLAKVSGIFKVSLIIGSYAAFFSATNMITPLAGAYGGGFASMFVFGFALLFRFCAGNLFTFKILAYYIPGLFASLYWAKTDIFFRLLVPIICISVFIIHPVGFYAAPYALYWFIPVFLYFKKQKSVFFHSLCSTFIAHGVGSVIWLYASQTTPMFWLGLIPVVLFERLVFASGMTLVYLCINSVLPIVKTKLNYANAWRSNIRLS